MVRAILQDRQGFMWIGTFGGGLNRYDGYQFTVYKPDPGDPTTLSHYVVWAIYEDRDGDLWVGTMNGLDRFDRTTETFIHYLEGQPVFSIYEDSAGTFWVGTGSGLIGLDRDAGTIERTYRYNPDAPDDPRMLSGQSVFAICEDRKGELWIGTSSGLDQFDRTAETFAHYRHDPDDPTSLSQNHVRAIYEDHQGVLWIGTFDGGLNRMDRSAGTFTRYQHDSGNPHSLSDDGVWAILEDSAGTLWVGTWNGLDLLDRSQNRFSHYRHDPVDPYSLSDDTILALYEDRSGVVWIGTNGNGLSKYSQRTNQFSHYQKRLDASASVADGLHSSPYVLSDSMVAAVYEDRQGILWIGTFNGGLNRLNRESGSITVYQHDPANPASLNSNAVYAVYEDRAGILWTGSGGWLERFDSQTETFIHHQYVGYQVERIIEDRSGNLWIGTPGGLYRLDRDRAILDSYLSGNDIQAVYADRVGAVWVGTFGGGLYVWDPASEQFANYRHDPNDPDSLSRDGVLAFYEDSPGAVWIGTWGGGLDRFDRSSQTFVHYTEKDGLPGDSVGCILADSAGFLWLGTVKGLSQFDPLTESFRHYDERDGMLSGGPALGPGVCFSSQAGEMFFGRSDGIDAFFPDQIEENPHIPPIVITAFDLFNQTVRRDLSSDEYIQLSYQENFVSFEFAALDYVTPEKNQYAYIMEGLDKDWVYAGTRRHADYPDLRPGDYVFRVKGTNNDGVWNEEGVTVRITITPPFWGTWWFRGIVALVLMGGAIGGYRLRIRGIEARSRELEVLVEERTVELRKESDQRIKAEEALRQSEMEKAVAAERSRLARELHDAVTQTLFSASLIAEALPTLWERDQAKGRQLLEKLRQMSRGALAEMRTLLLEMRPAALAEMNLEDLLRQLAQAATGRMGVPVVVVVESECTLSSDVHAALYRIAQEALNNVVKHAQANQVVVSLRCLPPAEEGGVELCISDDGQGFDPGDIPTGHLGLGIMRERAQDIGAAFEVESRPGHGTRITVVWEEK
jgi:signal transduction histidine kinase/ligand-binding sensor domain-containing protein